MSDWVSERIFATRADLEPVVQEAEAAAELQYVRSGMFPDPRLERFRSALEIPVFGQSLAGNHTQDPSFLVGSRKKEIRSREVIQVRGGSRFTVDSLENPGFAVIRFGGVTEGSVIIDGEVAARRDDTEAQRIQRLFVIAIRSRYKKIRSYRVGPEALQKLSLGWRLTTGVRAPPEYDLSP